MKNKLLRILFSAACCAFNMHAFAIEPSDCLESKFSEVDTLYKLPPQVIKSLEGISDRGAAFNPTDVGGATPPRFGMAAVSADCILVTVEKGGVGYNVQLWYFVRTDADWRLSDKLDFREIAQPKSMQNFLNSARLTFANDTEVGQMYAEGKILPQNFAEAAKWFQYAVNKGDGKAEELLGNMYAEGKGVKRDDVEAVRLYRLAVNTSQISSGSQLAMMYAMGRGVSANRVVAYALIGFSEGPSGPANAQLRDMFKTLNKREISAAKALLKGLLDAHEEDIHKNGIKTGVTDALDKYVTNPKVKERLASNVPKAH